MTVCGRQPSLDHLRDPQVFVVTQKPKTLQQKRRKQKNYSLYSAPLYCQMRNATIAHEATFKLSGPHPTLD